MHQDRDAALGPALEEVSVFTVWRVQQYAVDWVLIKGLQRRQGNFRATMARDCVMKM